MRRIWAAWFVSLSALAKPIHAPLPAEVYSAKSIAIVNHTGTQTVVDKAYEELTKWGRFKIVQNPDDADVILLVEMDRSTRGATASSYGGTTTLNEHTVMTITTSFSLKGQREPFFTEQERATPFRKSATQRGIDDLKKRLDEGPPTP